ncbi:hypothetical protein R3P38DRAFT_1567823 [Favolaschia claudopus]|uniref:Uncharacterized protein n=1 Tax=Favolaschia claudopus TaxID=2862362 RepID=A0AAW0AHZ9_9AGAR
MSACECSEAFSARDMNFPSGRSFTTISGGVGGSGGAGAVEGGTGGSGEGPQFHISAIEKWNVLVNGNAYYHCNTITHACQELVVKRQMPANWILPILRCLAEYIEGDKEKALFVVYCAAFALLCPGSLKVTDRLRLVPLIALPFLAIPSMLSLHDTITLVDVTGQRRPIFLAVWKNREAFIKTLQELFVDNEEISTIIRSDQYRIQDAGCSVYRPGSRVVAAGVTLFMTALFYRSRMSCPWCDSQVQFSSGWNLEASIDWLSAEVFDIKYNPDKSRWSLAHEPWFKCPVFLESSNSETPSRNCAALLRFGRTSRT